MQRILYLVALLLFTPQWAYADSHPLVIKEVLPAPLPTEAGKKLFKANGCFMCHGNAGRGNGPMAEGLKNKPRNFTSYDEMNRMSMMRMEQALRNGLEGTAMPAFPNLSDTDIKDLLNYVHSFLAPIHGEFNLCFHQEIEIDAKALKKHIEVTGDDPENFETEVRNGVIIIRPKNWPNLMGKQHMRPSFRVTEDDQTVAVIALRFNQCATELMDLLKTLTKHHSDS